MYVLYIYSSWQTGQTVILELLSISDYVSASLNA